MRFVFPASLTRCSIRGDVPRRRCTFPGPARLVRGPALAPSPNGERTPVGSDLVLADLARVDLFLMQEALYILGAFYLPRQVHARAFVRQVAVIQGRPWRSSTAPIPGVLSSHIS